MSAFLQGVTAPYIWEADDDFMEWLRRLEGNPDWWRYAYSGDIEFAYRAYLLGRKVELTKNAK